ncbi:MAG: major capsid protein [Prevotella sp.]|nr:major capsid protein [Prevotella sp.]
MEKSLYFQYAEKYVPQLVTSTVELLNGKSSDELPYLYQRMLRTVFSADGKWSSLVAKHTRVKADVVALDSELPIKSRSSIERLNGDIPKLGMKYALDEKQMKEIDNMLANASISERTIVEKIFEDVPHSVEGIYEELEDIFQSELSSGYGLAHNNVGQGIRLDMGFYDENKFGVSKLWNAEDADAIKDIDKVFKKAKKDGNRITDIYVDDTWLDAFENNKAVRTLYGFQQGFSGSATVPILDEEQAASVIRRKWKANLHLVDRRIISEANGEREDFCAWANGVASFVCDEVVGDLVWTTCAEMSRQVPGVTYQIANEFILVSQYSSNEPLREYTTSQAMVVPVLNNVNKIYLLNSTELVA